MPFYWSEHAEIGLNFLPSWSQECILPENKIVEAENRLNLKFPTVLRKFYADWGNHEILFRLIEYVYQPNECSLRTNHLEISQENQWSHSWGIPLTEIKNPNPPIYDVENGLENDQWNLSFQTLSDYLDYVTFGHAFAYESDCVAYGQTSSKGIDYVEILLENGFKKLTLHSNHFGLVPRVKTHWEILHSNSAIINFNLMKGITVKSKFSQEIDFIGDLVKINWKTVRLL